ncbi:MAG: LegC family aminotransferase [Verrucomicrobiota bacterium]
MSDSAKSLSEQILTALNAVLGEACSAIGLHEPWLTSSEQEAVAKCVASGWVSSVGPEVTRFEERLAALFDVPYAVAMVNGTAALHLALELSGVMPNEEVLIPSLTFVATANAVSHCGAIPHFVDSETTTLGMCPIRLESHLQQVAEVRNGSTYNRQTGRRIAALMPVHLFGHAAQIDKLAEIGQRWNLPLVEDAAEALGTRYKGKACGSFGSLSGTSFNGNKIITTGGGGAILTNDESLAKRAKHLSTTAKLPHPWAFVHDHVAYNYRLPNLNAAMGCAQLDKLPVILQNKKVLTEKYRHAFSGMSEVTFFLQTKDCESTYWLNTLILPPNDGLLRDEVLSTAHAKGYLLRPLWQPIHTLPMYQAAPRSDLKTAEDLAKRVINLPSSPQLIQS